MAEFIGALSAGLGIASFLLQVGTGIETIRKTISYNRHQASVDLESIAVDFEKLQEVIKGIQDIQNNAKDIQDFRNHALIELVIEGCRQMFIEVEDELGKFIQIFGYKKTPRSRLTSLKTQLMSKAEDNVRKMREKLRQIMDRLLWVSMLLIQLEANQDKHTGPVPSVTIESSAAVESAQSFNKAAAEFPCLRNRSLVRRRRPSTRIGKACSHTQMSYVSRPFWWLEFTPIRGLWHKCGTDRSARCQWSAKLRLALTWINIPYAVTASFAFTCDNGQYALRPALAIQHVVKNTSPGFEALFLCETLRISVDECKHRLRDMYQSDAYFKHHVNPAGKSYLRHLVSHPWSFQGTQFELVDLFLSELAIDFAAEDPGLLIDCSHWIGEGWHLHLLITILENGFAPVALDPPATNRWPQPCNPNWRCQSITSDPFFIDYFSLIVRHGPQFAGVTDTQAHILTGATLPGLGPELANHRERCFQVNFLGQSSLHLAVGDIKAVAVLLELGHDLDSTDNWGLTPLMYAAAMGSDEVAIRLLMKGANPCLQDLRFKRNFLDYAIVRGHWNLIHKTLSALHDIYEPEEHQTCVAFVIARAMASSIFTVTEEIRRQHVSEVIQLCYSVNFTVDDGSVTDNNLMHYAETVEEAEALVRRGFDSFSKPNSDGRLAIHSKVRNRELLTFCIDHGSNINHVDSKGQTLLFMLLSGLGERNATRALTLQQIRFCLDRGADHRRSDNCKCLCSTGGCSSSSIFQVEFRETWSLRGLDPDIVCAFEWQSILRETFGEEAVKEFLLSLIRRIEFDELGMTHVCCHRGAGIHSKPNPWECDTYPKAMDDQDIGDILEEEDEFIDILDGTMRELALRPMKDLQKELLRRIKTRHDDHLQRFAEETKRESRQSNEAMERSDRSLRIDDKKDQFVEQFVTSISLLREYCMPRSLAAYIVQLDLESCRENDSVSGMTKSNAWSSWRVDWVKEFMGVFTLSTADIAIYLDDEISRAGLNLSKHHGKKVKDRCIAFCGTDSF